MRKLRRFAALIASVLFALPSGVAANNRVNWYAQSNPISTNLNLMQRYQRIGEGAFLWNAFGNNASFGGVFSNLGVAAAGGLNVNVGPVNTSFPGTLYAIGADDTANYPATQPSGATGLSLAADSTQLLLEVAVTSATGTIATTAGSAGGQSVANLIECKPLIADQTSQTINLITSSGGSAGTASVNRDRNDTLSCQAKASASSSSPTVPSVDSGYTPIGYVIVPFGTSTVTSGMITTYSQFPGFALAGTVGASAIDTSSIAQTKIGSFTDLNNISAAGNISSTAGYLSAATAANAGALYLGSSGTNKIDYGQTTASTFTLSGNTTVVGTLAATTLAISGNGTVTGTLGVTGATTTAGITDSSGISTTGTLSAAGNISSTAGFLKASSAANAGALYLGSSGLNKFDYGQTNASTFTLSGNTIIVGGLVTSGLIVNAPATINGTLTAASSNIIASGGFFQASSAANAGALYLGSSGSNKFDFGQTTAGKFTLTADTNVNGTVTATGVTVNGNPSIHGSLQVDNNISFGTGGTGGTLYGASGNIIVTGSISSSGSYLSTSQGTNIGTVFFGSAGTIKLDYGSTSAGKWTLGGLSTAGVVTNNSSGTLTSVAPGTNGNFLMSNGSSWISGAPANSVATNGYVALPGGMYEEWGQVGPYSSEGGLGVSFPFTLPHAVLNAQASLYMTTTTNPTGVDQSCQIQSPSAGGMTVFMQQNGGGTYTYPQYCYWKIVGY